jgi:predicted TIM-barrel fold metal-dependent hydrolase
MRRREFIAGLGGAAAWLAVGHQGAAQSKRVIVDSQVHMWPASSPERPWFPGRAQLPEPFTIERVVPLMDQAGVDRVIIVPPPMEGDRIDYAQEAARRHPGRFAVMARISPNDPSAASRFPALKEQLGVLGIRLTFLASIGTAGSLRDGTADWIWPAAETAGLPIMFITTGQTSEFARIADRHPRLTLIVDHMGVSTEAWRHGLLSDEINQTVALAKYQNVSVKLSASPMYSAEPYPFRDMTPYLQRLFDVYGPRRCYWGTDLTNSFAKATYRQRVTHFTEELGFLSEDDKDWVMGWAILTRLGWA